MTPLAPLEPYIAVDEASFSTSIDFISAGFMALRLPPGKPSITTSGPPSAFMEFTPRTRSVGAAPAAQDEFTILSPAMRPWSKSATWAAGIFFKVSAALMEDIAPVKSDFRCTP